ncbi:AAA family ATPase [Paraburkholderia bannensis]|uniref:AAA family ATPase n=1 Tax=Paraburkholderia bannensis TaxID=765414 RepID=UPI002AC34307|nr:AAA family ATPase [Paraburkholderia bannensis]
MIFIDRRSFPEPPELKSKRAQNYREKARKFFSSESAEYVKQARFNFEPSVWVGVKPALMAMTHGKCAYCESRLLDIQLLDVDHFRPKEGAQNVDEPSDHRYYGWLAYDWENLLPSCSVCNRQTRSAGSFAGKGRMFPVDGDRAPLLASVSECRSVEHETLIDPSYDEPHDHLTFNAEGECISKTSRGELTISILGLNRLSLVRERAALRARIILAVERILDCMRAKSSSRLDVAIRDLCELTNAEAPYAGAARVFTVDAVEERVASRDVLPAGSELLALLNNQFEQQSWSTRGLSSYYSDTSAFRSATAPASIRLGKYPGREMLPAIPHAWVSRIEIRNFKAIEHLVLSTPPYTQDRESFASALVLLGENAAGKSSVLEAVTLALLGVDAIQGRLDGEQFLKRDSDWKTTGDDAHVKLFLNGSEEPVCWITIDAKTGKFHGTQDRQVVALAYGPRRFFSDIEENKDSYDVLDSVRSIFDSKATLSDPMNSLLSCTEDDFNAAVRALREVLMLEPGSLIRRIPDDIQRGAKGTGLYVFAHNRSTPIDRMSEGYRSVVALTCSIIFEMLRYWPDLESAHGVVLIDELDVHLHPRWKIRILRALRAAFPRIQFITTTHDPLCLRGAYDGEVQVLRRDEEHRIARVEDLPNVERLTVEQLLTSNFFGMLTTQNVESELALTRFIALSSVENRTPDDEAELAQLENDLKASMVVGQTPQQRLIYDIANEYLLRNRSGNLNDSERDKGHAADRMIDIWESLRTGRELP